MSLMNNFMGQNNKIDNNDIQYTQQTNIKSSNYSFNS